MEKCTKYMDNYTAQIAISESDFPIVADCDCLRATEAFYHMDRVTDFCVMIYVTEGIMYVTEDGHDYEISPGEILFLKSGLRHYGRFETPRGTSWIYAHFRLTDGGQSAKSSIPLPKKLSSPPGGEIETGLRRLCEYYHSKEPIKRIKINAVLHGILLEILSEQPKIESVCDKVCKYLDAQTDRDFKKELIGSRFFMSYSHLAATFKRENGVSMGRYHNDMRMKRACLLLRTTLMTVGEISASLGFSDMLYFSRKFHAYSGVSPTEYRKQAQKRY